jgi:N-carbamoylputrescine amidase
VKLRVTVCQWPDSKAAITDAWAELVDHVKSISSDLVVLPEMPFYPWLAISRRFNPAQWAEAVAAHDQWEGRFHELGGAAVLGTRPADFGDERYNEGFVWEQATGTRAAHAKSYLANEEGAWEAIWYNAATPDFTPAPVADTHVGFLISTELWAMEQARLYGADGAQLIATPRVTSGASREKWLAAGRTAAVLAGAFGISSNRADERGGYGGLGWIIDPNGKTLAMTTDEMPFITAQIDLSQAERARSTYPRYVFAPKAEVAWARQSA